MLPGVLYADGLRGRSGFPTPAKGSLVRFRRAPRYLRPPSTASASRRLHPPSSLSPPSESCGLRPASRPGCLAAPDREAPPLGFLALIAASTDGVHLLRGVPDPALRSVLGVSHAPDGLLRHLPCGFVSPRSHVQGLPSRGLSLARSRTEFPRPVHALLSLDAKCLRCDPRQPSRPRLQGFAPRGECGGSRNLFRVPSAPRPSWALPPPGPHSKHRGNDFALPPPTAFLRGEPAAIGPRRIDGAGHG